MNEAVPKPGLEMAEGNRPTRAYRHPLAVRAWHWLNAGCFVILLLSGFQIFNAHPRLYLGDTGYYDTPAIFEIGGRPDVIRQESWVRFGSVQIPTTHVLGGAEVTGMGVRNLAFPPWLRLPSKNHLGLGRGWHFLTAWVFAISLTSYLLYVLMRGRLRATLLPERDQLDRAAVARDIRMHLRLKHHKGTEALRYNLLQKVSYLLVLFLLLPTMIATGMTMSNSAVAAFPWLIDLFHGRQTARAVHFICAMSLLTFVLIHLFQVVVAGFRREMRSMLTGWYEPALEEDQ